jgi:hypothetical protein
VRAGSSGASCFDLMTHIRDTDQRIETDNRALSEQNCEPVSGRDPDRSSAQRIRWVIGVKRTTRMTEDRAAGERLMGGRR